MNDKPLSRRDFLKRTAVVGAGLAVAPVIAACGGATPTAAPAQPGAAAAPTTAPAAKAAAQFDWKQFKGQKIEALFAKGPLSDVIEKYLPEFEEMTGIKVGYEAPPEQQQRQKMLVEFNSGQPSFDIVGYSFHVQKRLFAKNKWLSDIRGWLADPKMTSPDFDWDDFSAAGKAWATESDGRVSAIPFKMDYWMLYANKDLFAAKGVAFPKTFDEMVAAAQKLHDPSNNVYGFLGRGLKNANVPLWTSLLLGWDATTVNEKGELLTESPESVAAAKLYQNLLKNYSAPGTAGFNWNECQSLFALGQAAMWFDGIGWAGPLEDKTKSKVAGKVAYIVPPAGPKTQISGSFCDGLAVAAASKNQGPAWYFAQWVGSKPMMARALAAGASSPPRNSTYTDPEALKSLTVPKEWVDCLLSCAKIGKPSLPIIIPVTEFRDIYGVALTNMIGGADAEAELKKATAEFKPILEKSEKG